MRRAVFHASIALIFCLSAHVITYTVGLVHRGVFRNKAQSVMPYSVPSDVIGSARLSTMFLSAKKGKKSQGKGKKKGFENKPQTETVDTAESVVETIETENKASISATGEPLASEVTDIDNDDIEDIMKKYGRDPAVASEERRAKKMKKNLRPKDQPPAFGESVLEKFPMSLQKKIDNVLITGTFIALTFVVLCGIGISFGAFKIVFKEIEIDPAIDKLIVDVLDPSFTPALGVFFFFSITLGLFKYAQISSDQTVYRED